MLKLFRKIRQNLLSEGKTSKYFKYAIGEIILVVIGILIALQINNWNENRKQKETLQSIYQIVKEDIRIDVTEINAFIDDFSSVRKPAFEAVLNQNLSKEDYLKHPEYLIVLTGFNDFEINQRGFELLKNHSNDIGVDKKNMASKINLFYNQRLIEINVAYSEIMREFVNNVNDYKQLPWFMSYFLQKETDGAIKYLMENPLAKNRITMYYLVYEIYVRELQEFKVEGEALIKQIDAIN